MGTIPTIPSFSAGAKLTAAQLNQMKAVSDFWALTPRCYAYQNAGQTLTTAVWGLITLDAEVYDIVQSGDTASHDTATNNSRVYVRTAGKYEIAGQVQIGSNTTGNRQAQIRLNAAGSSTGGTMIANQTQSPANGVSTSVLLPTVELVLAAGDYLEIFGYQNSGGNLNTIAGQGVTFLRMKLTGS